MVFHITNYMRETNVWMIRKMRWMLWGMVSFIPIYRNVYWDYHSRRVAWKSYLGDRRSEAQKQEDANNLRADWGYNPRYTPTLDISLKKRKHDAQTPEQKMDDTPRLWTSW